MGVSHERTAPVTLESAVDRLLCADMECFERELHDYVVAVAREVLAEELARLDVDLPAVTIKVVFRRLLTDAPRLSLR